MKLRRTNNLYYYQLNSQEKNEWNNQNSISIPEWILQLPKNKLSVYGKLILGQVLTQIIGNGYCDKSNRTIANELDISPRKVINELKQCVKLHLISVYYSNSVAKKGYRNFYLSPKNYLKIVNMNQNL